MIKSKGVALILSVIILTAVLAIALTAGKVFTDKLKMSRNTSDSMKAYYAAESGIEYALYRIKNSLEIEASYKCNADMTNWQTIDGAFYCLKQEGDLIKAIGKAGGTKRGIEVALAAGTSEFGVINNVSSGSPNTACEAAGYTASTGALYQVPLNNMLLSDAENTNLVGSIYNVQCYK